MASVITISKDVFDKDELIHRIKSGDIPHDAISWAAENGYIELTKMLIDAGAEINENGNYPLELSSRNGHTEIVKLLLDAGANTQDSEEEGYCLRMAAWNAYANIVRMLIKAGADPSAGNYQALRLALDKQQMDVVEILLDAIYEKREIIRR